MSVPTGPIATKSPQGKSFGIAWEDITRYDADLHKAADPVGWPVDRLRGHIVIESQGNPEATQLNFSNGLSYGLFQVVPYGVGWEGWHRQVEELAGLGADARRRRVIDALYDPAVNIPVGVAILESFYQEHRTLDRSSSAFFTGNPTWSGGDSVNGIAGWQYRECLNALIKEQEAFAAVDPDPIRVIVGGSYPPIDYGWMADVGLSYYAYGIGHGTQRATQHTGYDVDVPLGTRLFSPISGVVDCVGGRGTPRWGQACGAYPDTITGGIGNITIFGDSGHKLTLGHCRTSLVQPGQRVSAGQQVGTSGGMNGPHCHVEVSVLRNGTYWLLDPGPALIEAMGGVAPVVYAGRIAIPQPGSFPNWWKVDVIEDGVTVRQSTDPDAPEVHAPLMKGESFDAVYIVIGQTGEPFWVSRPGDGIEFGSRIPLKGTKLFGPAIFSAATAPDASDLLDSLYGLQAALEATQRVTSETITELGGEGS